MACSTVHSRASLTQFSSAKLFDTLGKQTPTFMRFSTVGGERGSADTERDPRGFALKFYTEEGNYDMVGNNTPIFFIRDPLKFPDFIHTQKRQAATNLKCPTMFWDFLSLTPECGHIDMPDPWYTGSYDLTVSLCEAAADALIARLAKG